jgi:hypothetical protein
LIDPTWLTCRHCIIAANFAPNPKPAALIGASQQSWTTGEFMVWLAERKRQVVIGADGTAAPTDDDQAVAEWHFAKKTPSGRLVELSDEPKRKVRKRMEHISFSSRPICRVSAPAAEGGPTGPGGGGPGHSDCRPEGTYLTAAPAARLSTLWRRHSGAERSRRPTGTGGR